MTTKTCGTMKLSDLAADSRWQSTHRGFSFQKSPVVWTAVERTTNGKYRISRNTMGNSWANRHIVRYRSPEQIVQLIPLTI